MKNKILASFDTVLGDISDGHQWVEPYAPPASSSTHQFVLFLKPEVTQHSRNTLSGVLDLVLATLQDWEVDIGAVRVLTGRYLEKHHIMDQHYGVLNAISKRGRSALAPAAEENLQRIYADELAAGAIVCGGHEFLSSQPDFSPLALTTLSDNLKGNKLGGGSYALSITIKGQVYILLNAFHAYQLEPFCRPDGAIVVLECRSDKPWADLRSRLAGATDPEQAADGSLRSQLLAHQDELRLPDVSQGSNGIHLSAGPLEGMVETRRFLTDHDSGQPLPWSDLAFGALLEEKGLSADAIDRLAENPMLTVDGDTESAFDLTEEKDAGASASRLADLV